MNLQGENKADFIVAEGMLANLLANFNTEFIYNTVEDLLQYRNTHFDLQPKHNIISALEIAFKDMINNYPGDKANILEVREQVYKEILHRLCRNGLSVSYVDSETNIYTLVKYLYDLCIARYDLFVFTFLRRFITIQKDYLYTALQLDTKRKSKDTSTIYNKNTFEDPKLAIIIANLDTVLHHICYDLDLDMYNAMSYMYYTEEDRLIMNYLTNYIDSGVNIIDCFIRPVLTNPLLFNPCFAHLKMLGNIKDVDHTEVGYDPEMNNHWRN